MTLRFWRQQAEHNVLLPNHVNTNGVIDPRTVWSIHFQSIQEQICQVLWKFNLCVEKTLSRPHACEFIDWGWTDLQHTTEQFLTLLFSSQVRSNRICICIKNFCPFYWFINFAKQMWKSLCGTPKTTCVRSLLSSSTSTETKTFTIQKFSPGKRRQIWSYLPLVLAAV